MGTARVCLRRPLHPAIPPVVRDPNEDKFLATALAGDAKYLVSEDQDVLTLREYQGVTIIDALTFLHILEEEESQPR